MNSVIRARSAAVRAGTAPRIVVPLLILLGLAGCQSVVPEIVPVDPETAIEKLNRPLSGDPAALYRMRVSSTDG
jgi:hypothetical protein